MSMGEPRVDGGGVRPLPPDVTEALGGFAAQLGGPYEPSVEYAGSVGRTMFDLPSSEDNTVTVLLPHKDLGALPSQALLRITSVPDGRSYVGVVVGGPFAEPDGLRGDAAVIVTTTVNGATFVPNFHGRVQVELMGEELARDGAAATLAPPRFRPLPNSPVFPLTAEETSAVLRCGGDMRLGLAVGHEQVVVSIPSDVKEVLPRHTGILGTTGGGKSTTVAGLIAYLQAAGIATILFDTEGEYTHLDEPTDNAAMVAALARAGAAPKGVEGTTVYHLTGRDTANPRHPRLYPFSLWFCNLAPHMVAEILEMNDAQQDRFMQAYEITHQLLRDFHVFPRQGNRDDEEKALNWDDQETGYPGLELSHLLDVVGAFMHAISKQPGDFAPFHRDFQAPDRRAKLMERVRQASTQTSHLTSRRAVSSRLHRLRRLKIFDVRGDGVSPVKYSQMLQPGSVSIVDLHDTDSVQVNNLAIAELLRGVQTYQEAAYAAALKEGRRPTPVVIIIEEAHEFLSAQRIAQEPTLFQQVARIARRGRKRWLGLVFVTQLPQHLPDEVFGLINNLILHKLSDSGVINRLRQRNVGNIDDSLWKRLPTLAPGQAVVSLASMARPLLVAIDPAGAKLRMVD